MSYAVIGSTDYTEDDFETGDFVTRERVLSWLLNASETDVEWVLNEFELSNRRIASHGSELSSAIKRTTTMLTLDVCESGLDDEMPKLDSTILCDAERLPIVQFVSPLHFVQLADQKVELDIIRIGDRTGETVVYFRTQDASAIAGREYVEKSGLVTFKPGEAQKSITLELLSSDFWKSTTDFLVLLTSENLSGAILGQYLYSTRLRLIDDTTFPSSAFQDVNWMADNPDCSRPQLLLHYFMMNWSIPTVRVATIKAVLVDWFHILTAFVELFLNVYLLDYILDKNMPVSDMFLTHSKQHSLLLLAVVRLFIFLLGYGLDFSKASFGLVGSCIVHLKGGLLRKYFNFRADVRDTLHPAEVLMAIERDVDILVREGYIHCIKLQHMIGTILSQVGFMIVCPRIIGSGSVNAPTVCCFCGLPFVLFLFLYCRTTQVEKYLHRVHQKGCDVAGTVTISTTHSDLIFGYGLRNYIYGRFRELSEAYFRSQKDYEHIEVNNSYFASWVTFLTISIYTYFGGMRVLQGDMTFGMFLTNLRIFVSFEFIFKELYSCLASMQTDLPHIARIAKLLNAPSDLYLRKQFETLAIGTTEEMRNLVLSQGDIGQAVMDELPIKLDLAEYKYENSTITSSISFGGSIQVKQGSLVAFVGNHNSGKSTLLHLISGMLLPCSVACKVFVPSHLRCVSVSASILFLAGTLMENLTLGIPKDHADARKERVLAICKDVLGLEGRVVQYLEEDHEHRWQEVFSGAQCRLLMLARALIFNSELIAIHKPLNGLSKSQITTVLGALRKHVDLKGLMQVSLASHRRLRTIFFSSNHDSTILHETAHCIVDLHPEGIRNVHDRSRGSCK